MNNQLPKIVHNRKKRLGRGYGSGKGGHTSGRGQKGQKARGSVGILFEGLKVKKSLIHRLPMLRGMNRFKAGAKPVIITLDMLNKLPDGMDVTVESLVEAGLVSAQKARRYGVKVLGTGTLTKKLTVSVPMSKSAQEKLK